MLSRIYRRRTIQCEFFRFTLIIRRFLFSCSFSGVQIAYCAIIGTQLSMVVLSITSIYGIYKVSRLILFHFITVKRRDDPTIAMFPVDNFHHQFFFLASTMRIIRMPCKPRRNNWLLASTRQAITDSFPCACLGRGPTLYICVYTHECYRMTELGEKRQLTSAERHHQNYFTFVGTNRLGFSRCSHFRCVMCASVFCVCSCVRLRQCTTHTLA